MQKMNDVGVILLNGRRDEADYTYHTNGDSMIDLIWVTQSSARDLGSAEMWFDATCAYSDHAMVTVDVKARQVAVNSTRKRKATDGWIGDLSGRWRRWNETFQEGAIRKIDSWERGKFFRT